MDLLNNSGKTALMKASYGGHVDVVRLLVEAGQHTIEHRHIRVM